MSRLYSGAMAENMKGFSSSSSLPSSLSPSSSTFSSAWVAWGQKVYSAATTTKGGKEARQEEEEEGEEQEKMTFGEEASFSSGLAGKEGGRGRGEKKKITLPHPLAIEEDG